MTNLLNSLTILISLFIALNLPQNSFASQDLNFQIGAKAKGESSNAKLISPLGSTFEYTETGGGARLHLRLNSGTLELRRFGALVASKALDGTSGIFINGQVDAEDSLEVDFSGGFFENPIHFDGGSGGYDTLLISEYDVDTVTHTFVNESDGSVDLFANSKHANIVYVGLEPVIDNANATDRVFTFTGGTETITLDDDGTASDNASMIDSTLGELVVFTNPTSSLTINAGTGFDSISYLGIDDANVIPNININGEADNDGLTIAFSEILTGSLITFDGGASTTGDQLALIGSAPAGHVEHFADGGNSGRIGILAGGTRVSFSSVENSVTDILNASQRTFRYQDIATATVTDDASAGNDRSSITATDHPRVDFTTPTDAAGVVLSGGAAANTFTLTSIDSSFDVNFTVNGSGGDDIITIGFPITGTVDGSSGNDTITVNAKVTGNLLGRTSVDTFNINAEVTGNVDGDSGNNIFNINARVGGDVEGSFGNDRFNLGANAEVVGEIIGSSGNDTLQTSTSGNVLNITGSGEGNIEGVTDSFSSIQIIEGQAGADTFNLQGGVISTLIGIGNSDIISGTGTISNLLTLSGTSNISPGESPGKITTTGLTFTASASYTVELNGPDPLTGYDQIQTSGTVNLASATLVPSLGYTPADGAVFMIIEIPGGGSFNGTFAGLAEGSEVEIGGRPFVISYVGGNGNDLTLTDALDTDGDGMLDSSDSDDDNDGVSDVQEAADGTNPKDAGSLVEKTGEEVCVEWNGFLGFLSQILELRNTSSVETVAVVTLYDINATARSSFGVSLQPGIQFDTIINDLDGFEIDTFGLVCAAITEGQINSLDGQLVTYRIEGTTYTLAYSSELLPARKGAQHLTYNTFQPSLDSFDQADFVANWAQIVNDESSPQGGVLSIYTQDGVLQEAIPVGLGANQRADVDIHRVGSFQTGLVSFVPNNPTAKIRLRQNRYYYGPNGISDLVEAVSLPAQLGNGEKLITAFDSRNRTATLEVSNVLNQTINVTIEIRDSAGNLASSQPPLFVLGPRATGGLVINQFLENSLGSITVDSDTVGSVIATRFEYGRAVDGSLLYANPAKMTEAVGMDLRGSYNSFLNQECRLKVANNSNAAESADVTMTRFDGTLLLNSFGISVPANGSLELDLCVNETEQAYGEVKLESTNPFTLSAEVIRQNAEGTIDFGGPLKP
jgi:hypothetical protein